MLILILSILSVSSASFAQFVTEDKDEIMKYAKAVEIAFDESDKLPLCYYSVLKPTSKKKDFYHSYYWNLNYIASSATRLIVTGGAQPLLTFILKKSPSQLRYFEIQDLEREDRITLTVRTSADYKQIVDATVQAFINYTVNTGDLKNPEIMDHWQKTQGRDCHIQI